MGLKYWDEKSGEFKEIALPYLKGDKGDTPEGVVSATPNSIPQRNANGNLFTGQTLGFESTKGTFLGGVHITEDGWLKHSVPNTGLADIHTSVTLPIEVGTWTPVACKEGDDSKTFVMAKDGSNYGHYQRVGNIVFVMCRAKWSSKNGLTDGKLIIKGLPYTPAYGYQTLTLGLTKGIGLPSTAMNHTIFLNANPYIQFYTNVSAGNYQTFNINNINNDGEVSISGFYFVK